MEIPGLYNFWVVIGLMMGGLYIVISRPNLIKKLIGLAIFQASVFVFYITIGKVSGGPAPIKIDAASVYSNPIPHVLILTAIVVGVSTMAIGLALIVRIQNAYGSIEEDKINRQDNSQ